MKPSTRKLLTIGGAVLGVGLFALFVASLRDAQGEDLTRLLGVEQRLNARVPDAKLVDEDGKSVQFSSYLNQGKPVALFFVFYKCRSGCVQEFDGALKAFRAMAKESIGKDYEVVTVSIHPKETPELARGVKAEYTSYYNRKGSESGWHFLTGSELEVKKLAQGVGFKYTYDEAKDRVIHPTCLILITPQGRLSKYFLGTSYPAAYVRDGLLAAKNEQIGAYEEPINIAGCFTFDPSTGKTLIRVQRAIQFTGILTAVIIALSIVNMLRQEKHLQQQEEELPS